MKLLRHLLQPFLLYPFPVTLAKILVAYNMKPVASARNVDGRCDICRKNPNAVVADCGAQIGLSPETEKAHTEDDAESEICLSLHKGRRRRVKKEQNRPERPFPAGHSKKSRLEQGYKYFVFSAEGGNRRVGRSRRRSPNPHARCQAWILRSLHMSRKSRAFPITAYYLRLRVSPSLLIFRYFRSNSL
jgi:hypothetical protein